MVYLTIKEVKKQLHIHVKFDSFDELPVQLAQRLAPYTVNRGLSAFFYLPALSDAQALSFLRLCRQLKLTLLGIDPLPPEAPLIRYREGTVRNGERLCVKGALQLFGCIRSSAQVRADGSLSVFGEVSGVIDLLHADCVLYAAALDHARIRIADSPFVELSSAHPCKVVYEEQSLKCIEAL